MAYAPITEDSWSMIVCETAVFVDVKVDAKAVYPIAGLTRELTTA